MDSIANFFVANKMIFIVAGAAVGFILLIVILKKLFSKRQRHKEVAQAAADRVRDENLNSVILNNYGNGDL